MKSLKSRAYIHDITKFIIMESYQTNLGIYACLDDELWKFFLAFLKKNGEQEKKNEGECFFDLSW